MAITMCCVASLFAQGSMNAYNYSRTDIKGTARYMGMGGAFGALGGDISTLSQIRRVSECIEVMKSLRLWV